MFFGHADPYLRFMANELQQQRPAANVMQWVREMDMAKGAEKAPGRNDVCPCGSGVKYKRCCGKAA